jgi:glycine/D-amino acid oxidase-like deaminating enzyme
LLVPEDAVLYPPCAARFLLERAQKRGAHTVLGEAVERIEEGLVFLSNGTTIAAGAIVNATGAWASHLTPGLDIKLRKGHLVITDRYPGFVRHQLIELGYLKSAHSLTSDSVAFNVQPRSTGQLLIGSSRQYDVTGKQVDDAILHRMLHRALEYMPGLAGTSAIRTWTGFRAATPDKLPLIGAIAGKKGLYMATGHEGLGITTSLGTAALITDQLMGRQPAISPDPYSPARTCLEYEHV